MWFVYYFNFERNFDVLKPKSPYILLNKNIKLNKNKTQELARKKRTFFVPLNLPEVNFFNICVLSQCKVY